MSATVRRALPTDIAEIQRIRRIVRENRLVSTVITDDAVRVMMEERGRGWVADVDGAVVGFAIGDATNGNVWALFVDPDHERRGYGRQLHDEMVAWLRDQGLELLWLTTAPGTRAERFYERAGWVRAGSTADGEILFELRTSNPERRTPNSEPRTLNCPPSREALRRGPP